MASPSPSQADWRRSLVDAGALAAELGDLAGGGYVLFDARRDTLGTWHDLRAMESTIGTDVESRVRDAVRTHMVPGPYEALELEVRVDLESPVRLRVGPIWGCSPAVQNRERLRWFMEQVGADVGISGTVVLDIAVEEDGSAGDVVVARSSGHADLDTAMMEAARHLRFHPGTMARQYVRAWVRMPLRKVATWSARTAWTAVRTRWS